MKGNSLQFSMLFILAMAISSSLAYPTWDEYMQMFPQKRTQYEQIDGEMERRQQRYQEVVASFAGITDYQPGVNKFTDWYVGEIQGLSTLQEIPATSRNQNAVPVSSRNKVGAPSSFDWRDRNVVTSVKDQGSCGSCWTFAAAAYAESRLIISGDYNKNNIDLSEQYLLQCTDYSTCSGGYMEYVMDSVKQCPLQRDYPYRPFTRYSGICSADGIRTGYDNYDYYNLSDEEMIDLLMKAPVAISIASSGWSSYTSGVFSCSSGAPVDHAVLLVGYTQNYWIIKNQWGSDWGQNGYIRISRGSNDCSVGRSAHVLSQNNISFAFLVMLSVFIGIFLF